MIVESHREMHSAFRTALVSVWLYKLLTRFVLRLFFFFCIDVYEAELNCCNERVRRWRQVSGRSAKWLKSRVTQRPRQRRRDVAWFSIDRGRSTQGFCCSVLNTRALRTEAEWSSGGGRRYSDRAERCSRQYKQRSGGGCEVPRILQFAVCACVWVMVARQVILVTGDLARWSLQVNEHRVMLVSLFVICKCFCSVSVGGVVFGEFFSLLICQLALCAFGYNYWMWPVEELFESFVR